MELQIFNNPEFGQVRLANVDGEPWAVGRDIANALGYVDSSKALAMHVDEEDKLTRQIVVSGQNRNVYVINESGIYSLILASKLPTAKKFKHWVTSEVLPAIRKHGAYMTEETLEQALTSPDFLIKLATELKQEKQKRLEAEQKIEADKPKVIFADAVSASHTSILVGEMAKLLRQNGIDIGQQRLFRWLRENGYLMKSGSSKNMPTQRSMEMGLFTIKEGSYVDSNGVNVITKTPKISGKGQIYFIEKFKKEQEKEKKKAELAV